MTAADAGWGVSTVPTARGRVGVRLRPAADHGVVTPLVAILHQSPLSGWTHEPVLDHLGHRGPVAVLDTPGYGLSDPLDPATDDLAVYAATLWDAIEIVRAGRPVVLVGQHTGGHLAMIMAAAHSGVVAAVVFHGVSLYTDDERAERAARYAPDIENAGDGTHLATIWARLAHLYPDVDIALRNRAVCDYLVARPGYASAYRAVFATPVAPMLEAFRTTGIPSAVLIGSADLIATRQDRVARELGSRVVRLPGLTDFAPWEAPADFAAALDELVDELLTQGSGPGGPHEH
ncbi:alpha/beta fold hydrolase [Pseudonocardia benzenivorans]|uniref:Alpha/beta hydrolase fold protein n=2 Tax=Pseudonocardia TaxID=1847 RepID=F4CUN1_PSEUX|nr:alpha/beta hydrolase [Pseudonocardia dioxanivorans]AEA26345.1 alpha/beta hydrolase fold protein [Pseudonocardia dioxanivorans CB1190]GJF03180.1 hypothetical protein PSD17_21410 [Pseudonocardia sp. D17]